MITVFVRLRYQAKIKYKANYKNKHVNNMTSPITLGMSPCAPGELTSIPWKTSLRIKIPLTLTHILYI
jgi:hypothetical protein